MRKVLNDKFLRDIHTSLGGRADKYQVATAAINALSEHDRESVFFEYVVSMVERALRDKSGGELAFAQAINGTYVQLPLMDEGEYRFVVRQHLKLSRNHRAIAERYVTHCYEHLGVDITDELAA